MKFDVHDVYQHRMNNSHCLIDGVDVHAFYYMMMHKPNRSLSPDELSLAARIGLYRSIHTTSRFHIVTVPYLFHQKGLHSHCLPCSITFQNRM
jgi:hypothetical protein